MVMYTVRRLLMLIPVLLGVTFLTFAIAQVTPGKPGGARARQLCRASDPSQKSSPQIVLLVDDNSSLV